MSNTNILRIFVYFVYFVLHELCVKIKTILVYVYFPHAIVCYQVLAGTDRFDLLLHYVLPTHSYHRLVAKLWNCTLRRSDRRRRRRWWRDISEFRNSFTFVNFNALKFYLKLKNHRIESPDKKTQEYFIVQFLNRNLLR